MRSYRREAAFIVLAAIVSLAAFAHPAHAECDQSRIVIGAGSAHLDVSWRIPRNGGCNATIESVNSFNAGLVTFTGLKIAQRPSHGSAGVRSNFSFAYQAAGGYVGKDHFSVISSYSGVRRRGLDGQATIDVEVDIGG